MLRPTFCSHLAMLAKLVVVIQVLAGHQHLVTTQRYMHLARRRSGMRSRDSGAPRIGDMLETGAKRWLISNDFKHLSPL